MDITYNPANDGLELYKYFTKFCWPADLDGDGEYDFVVDRLSVDGGTHKIQAYLRNGTLLWTVDMGPNVSIDQGQDDMVIAYDMDGDNKAEVVIKSSDGTKFANGKGVFGSTTLDTDNDGIVDAGETIDLAIVIRNQWGKADAVALSLAAQAQGAPQPDTYVEMITGTVSYGAVGSFSEDDNAFDPANGTALRSIWSCRLRAG